MSLDLRRILSSHILHSVSVPFRTPPYGLNSPAAPLSSHLITPPPRALSTCRLFTAVGHSWCSLLRRRHPQSLTPLIFPDLFYHFCCCQYCLCLNYLLRFRCYTIGLCRSTSSATCHGKQTSHTQSALFVECAPILPSKHRVDTKYPPDSPYRPILGHSSSADGAQYPLKEPKHCTPAISIYIRHHGYIQPVLARYA